MYMRHLRLVMGGIDMECVCRAWCDGVWVWSWSAPFWKRGCQGCYCRGRPVGMTSATQGHTLVVIVEVRALVRETLKPAMVRVGRQMGAVRVARAVARCGNGVVRVEEVQVALRRTMRAAMQSVL